MNLPPSPPVRPATPRTGSGAVGESPLHTPYVPRLGIPTPNDYPREWIDGFHSGKYKDIPFYDGWKRGEKLALVRPEQVSLDAEVENSRAAARCQALESPLAPQSSAIPQSEIASYPREWRDGARSGRYSYIPSYQGWRHGEQLELAQTEQSGPSGLVERPLYENPGPSTRAEPIEQPAFEGP